MKTGIVILSICFLLSVSNEVYLPSFTSPSGFDSSTLSYVVDDAFNYSRKAAESLVAVYQDFMASSRIVYFFKYYLSSDQRPGTMIIFVSGLVGLVGYGRRRLKK